MRMIKSKRASWINIIEAFIAILLIAGVFLVVINKGYIGKKDISGKVRDFQVAALREMQTCDKCRTEVTSINLGVCADTFSSVRLDAAKASETMKILENRQPAYLYCALKVCLLDKICEFTELDKQGTEAQTSAKKDIYAESVAITTDGTDSSFCTRQLKMFCWAK